MNSVVVAISKLIEFFTSWWSKKQGDKARDVRKVEREQADKFKQDVKEDIDNGKIDEINKVFGWDEKS